MIGDDQSRKTLCPGIVEPTTRPIDTEASANF